MIVECDYCGSEHYKRPYKISKNINNYCSLECAAKGGGDRQRKYDINISYYMSQMQTGGNRKTNKIGKLKDENECIKMSKHIMEIWTGKCALSGIEITRSQRGEGTKSSYNDEKNPFKIASIDRIDSNKPYEIGNVQWVSQAINFAKNNTPNDEFKQYLNETLLAK